MTLTAQQIMQPFLHTDLADEFLVAKLKDSVRFSLDWLEMFSDRNLTTDPLFQDFVDNIHHVRACITVLQWYSLDDYTEYTKEVNKYASTLEKGFY